MSIERGKTFTWGARRRTVEIDLSLESSAVDVHEEAWLRARRDRVRAALGELSDSQRDPAGSWTAGPSSAVSFLISNVTVRNEK